MGSRSFRISGTLLNPKHVPNDQDVLFLHDRRVPGHGSANIDQIAIGPAGVLVIDTKSHTGKIKTERIGGLFAPRRTVLLINGRDQTRLIDGVERQVGYVRDALDGIADDIEVRSALCFPNVDGLPLFGHLQVRDVVIDGPKPIAKLASRPGLITTRMTIGRPDSCVSGGAVRRPTRPSMSGPVRNPQRDRWEGAAPG